MQLLFRGVFSGQMKQKLNFGYNNQCYAWKEKIEAFKIPSHTKHGGGGDIMLWAYFAGKDTRWHTEDI